MGDIFDMGKFLITPENPIVLSLHTTKHLWICTKCNTTYITADKHKAICNHLWLHKTYCGTVGCVTHFTKADIDQRRRLKTYGNP